MGTGSMVFITLGLGILYCARSADAQYYNSYPNLENTCNQSLTIECPYTYTGRAGTFRYYFIPDLPTGLCYFNVTLASSCGRPWDFFAFYFNIRKFVLPTADYVRIYGTDRLAPRILLKELTGSYTAWSNPSSVSQALTSYAKQPSFTFEYFRSTFASTGVHEAYIDFVVVEDSSHSMNTRCTALSGYVNNNFICHTDGANDRVNCPASFNPVVYGMNPVYTRQPCIAQPTSPYYSYTSTPSYWNSHGSYDYGLSSGAITGIVMGSVFFVVFLIAVVSAACSASRKTSPSRPIVLTSTSGSMQTSRPIVVGAPVGPDPPFMGAPPSYAEVTATPMPVSIPMPQPPAPKY